MTPEEKAELLQLLDAYERTVALCRACATTTRDLAWEVRRGHAPDPDALTQTIEESERVLDQLGRIEISIAEMKASVW